jgi:hypothetical protein
MKPLLLLISIFITGYCTGQPFDISKYAVEIDSTTAFNDYFKKDSVWRGADGASSIDLGNGKVLWLFGDTFISDSAGSRKKSELIRNSVAIQTGYDLQTASLSYFWNQSKNKPRSFFHREDKYWYWPGHAVMIKERLLIFLMKEHEVKEGLGFESIGWDAVLISNPQDDPRKWKMKYINGGETYGTVAGSAAVLSDEKYIYAYGAVEPGTHEVYLLRWKTNEAYSGNLTMPYWWLNGKWGKRKNKDESPQLLFTGATEYSVHYDSSINKYIQFQSFGFGEAAVGVRLADSLTGPWTDSLMIYAPAYTGIKRPFMYSVKAHPELTGNGVYLTYNINSFDFDELLVNQDIYFPKFIRVKIFKK